RETIEHDGFLVPVLMLDVVNQGPIILMLMDMPNTTEQRTVYFAKIGTQFRLFGQRIQAAVSLGESWMVQAHQAPAALRMRPSQHPSRQKTLALLGRNADNTRTTQVIQPFSRDTTNKLVWREPLLALYNEPVENGHHTQSVLDELFVANQA